MNTPCQNGTAGPKGVTLFLVEEFTHLAFSCAIEPLRIANLVSGKELYRWRLASENGETATSSSQSVTLVDQGMVPTPSGETLFFLSGINAENHITPALLSYVRKERSRGTKIGAICSGALILAKAGLLEDEPASIHWQFHDSFAEEFPNIELRQSVFVTDGRHPTASGGTAAADLMLHLIGQDHGEEMVTEIADQMVYNTVRDSGASQRISIQARYGIRNPHIAKAVRMMSVVQDEPIAPSTIAARIGISTRQLERLFSRYLKCTPNRFATDLRLEKARNLLLQTEFSVTEVALACGFSSTSYFTRVYRRRYDVTPTQQRANPVN